MRILLVGRTQQAPQMKEVGLDKKRDQTKDSLIRPSVWFWHSFALGLRATTRKMGIEAPTDHRHSRFKGVDLTR
ncbi:hypothetical protein X762_30365 [Mesorhizobium sp. LSHC426A00]|nr:hypothetical protein X762_30365 [Mesorhizobium sp. LSHC426A00]ESX45433.1 hypothetical protein X761_32225 [Mesorhizobium sp. LSHC424B00]